VPITIHALCTETAQDFLTMLLQLDLETDTMMFEPNERPNDTGIIHQNINTGKTNGSVVFLAYENEQCVGFVAANRGGLKRICHIAYIATGVLKDFRGRGIGNRLFTELLSWAKTNNLKRLELTVMAHNAAAIALYQKYGFEIEGTKKQSMFVNGEYVDEFYMAITNI